MLPSSAGRRETAARTAQVPKIDAWDPVLWTAVKFPSKFHQQLTFGARVLGNKPRGRRIGSFRVLSVSVSVS